MCDFLQAQRPWGKLCHCVCDCLQAQRPWGKLCHCVYLPAGTEAMGQVKPWAGCVIVCDCLQALKPWGRLCHCVHLPAGSETMGQAAAEGAGCKERVPHCMSHREKYSQPGKQCSRGCLCVTRQCESLQLFFLPFSVSSDTSQIVVVVVTVCVCVCTCVGVILFFSSSFVFVFCSVVKLTECCIHVVTDLIIT